MKSFNQTITVHLDLLLSEGRSSSMAFLFPRQLLLPLLSVAMEMELKSLTFCSGSSSRCSTSSGSTDFLLIMWGLIFSMSDNCRGLRKNSSAPSSRHLFIRDGSFSEDIITTGISLSEEFSWIIVGKIQVYSKINEKPTRLFTLIFFSRS